MPPPSNQARAKSPHQIIRENGMPISEKVMVRLAVDSAAISSVIAPAAASALDNNAIQESPRDVSKRGLRGRGLRKSDGDDREQLTALKQCLELQSSVGSDLCTAADGARGS